MIGAVEDGQNDGLEAQKERLADVGTISLHMYRVRITQLNTKYEIKERQVQHPEAVHEKALKGGALSHAVR